MGKLVDIINMAKVMSFRKKIALTIDDLPFIGVSTQQTTIELCIAQMISSLLEHHIPSVGFVNTGVNVPGINEDFMARQLFKWAKANVELGNHTHSHLDFHLTAPNIFEQDIEKCDRLTRDIASVDRLRYFRFPYNHTGETMEKRVIGQRMMAFNQYILTPYTIDASDYIFNYAYEVALSKPSGARRKQIVDFYLKYLEEMIAYAEYLSNQCFGRVIPQILLIHANCLTAATLKPIITLLHNRGFRFVKLIEVLKDCAYGMPEMYVGNEGPSWLVRYRMAMKIPMGDRRKPFVPDSLLKMWEVYNARTYRVLS